MKRHEPAAPVQPSFTSLIDIAFLVLIFFMALPLKNLDGKLEAFLPRDRGIELTRSEPEHTVRIRVVHRDGRSQYRLGEHEAERAQDLERVLRALGADNRYEVHADARVPWDDIVDVVDLLKALDYEKMSFTGTTIPSSDLRGLYRLPAPQ